MSDSLQPHGLWPVRGILQARTLEWVVISFSRESSWPRGSSWPRDRTHGFCLAGRFFTTEPPGPQKAMIRSDQSLSRVRLFATLWIAARQASLSITNSRSSLRLTSIESVKPSSHLILSPPLLLLPPIPPLIKKKKIRMLRLRSNNKLTRIWQIIIYSLILLLFARLRVWAWDFMKFWIQILTQTFSIYMTSD